MIVAYLMWESWCVTVASLAVRFTVASVTQQ